MWDFAGNGDEDVSGDMDRTKGGGVETACQAKWERCFTRIRRICKGVRERF